VCQVAGLPTLCVINVMMPDYTPSVMKKTATVSDGKGVSVVIHARMTPETVEAMASAGPDDPEHRCAPSVRLPCPHHKKKKKQKEPTF
jgi:hypothetical protein